jgi:hypothetical protein
MMASSTEHWWQKPGSQAKLAIARAIFSPSLQIHNLSSLDQYFVYYERELLMLQFGRLGSTQLSIELAIQTHEDLLFVVETLQSSGNVTKRQIRDQLQVRFANADEPALNATINLGLRVWLMINVRDYSERIHAPQTPVLMWEDGLLFQDFLDRAFPKSEWQIGVKDGLLDPSFTATFMSEVCNLRIEWTDCLADHLRLDRRQRVLRIYPYKICLLHHLVRAQEGATGTAPM